MCDILSGDRIQSRNTRNFVYGRDCVYTQVSGYKTN